MTTIFNHLSFLKIDAYVYKHDRKSLEMVSIGSHSDIEIKKQHYYGRKDVFEYKSYIENQHAHSSLVFHHGKVLRVLRKKGPLISDSETFNQYRGKGIYPFTIFSIAKEYILQKNHPEIFMLVVPTNIPSIKGIEKAGFIRQCRIKTTRFLGIYFNQQIIREND